MAKVLLTGATGTIGRAVLEQCLAHPDISSIIAFTRRQLPDKVASNPKLQVKIMEDFSVWPEELLRPHKDATGMIWAMGDYEGNEDVTVEYPLAFQNAFIQIRNQSYPYEKVPFNYVHLSGKLSVQDQSQTLYFMPKPRKLKGFHELRAIDLAKSHEPWFRLHIVRPGGVLPNQGWGAILQELAMRRSWVVRARELGVYMVYAALGGENSDTVIMNERIVEKGRELLRI